MGCGPGRDVDEYLSNHPAADVLIDSIDNRNLTLASRNARELKTVDALSVNVYDVVDRSYLVVSESALNRLVEVLAK